MQSILRLTNFGLVNFWRNLWLNLLATFVMSLTLLTITMLIVAALFVNTEIAKVENKIDFEIFLQDNTTDENITKLKEEIYSAVTVTDWQFVTKEEAVQRYKDIYGDNDSLINYIEQENPLKASIIIKTAQPDELEKINTLVNSDQFSNVIYSSSYSHNRAIIVRLIGVINFIERAGAAIGLILMLIAIAVVFSTVRIAIYSRKEEIEIMKLVGATDWFVHAPFLIESGVIGVLAALLSTGFVVGAIYYISQVAQVYIGLSSFVWQSYLGEYLLFIVVFQILLGLLVSVASAFFAIRSHV
jgi:cell division transport system permease protein